MPAKLFVHTFTDSRSVKLTKSKLPDIINPLALNALTALAFLITI
jgi:hypothetical protein